jgi:hypothetical protein
VTVEAVAVANLVTEAQLERTPVLQILETSFPQIPTVLTLLSEQVSGNLLDVVELDDLDILCGSRRTLLWRTLWSALFNINNCL